MSGPAVQFNYETWISRYPEFGGVSEELALLYFQEAGLYFVNVAGSWQGSLSQAPLLLYMLTAHIAQLNAPLDGNPSEQIVGRVNSASQGSVSVGLDFPLNGSPSQAWFAQTKYGAAFWQATAQFRRARYRARPTLVQGDTYPIRWPGWPSGGPY